MGSFGANGCLVIGSVVVVVGNRFLLLCLAGNSVWASAPFGRVPLTVDQESCPELFQFPYSAGLPWRTRLTRGFHHCCGIDTSSDDSSVLEQDVANLHHICMLFWRASVHITILVGHGSDRGNATEPRLQEQMEALPTDSGEIGGGLFDIACRGQEVAAHCRVSRGEGVAEDSWRLVLFGRLTHNRLPCGHQQHRREIPGLKSTAEAAAEIWFRRMDNYEKTSMVWFLETLGVGRVFLDDVCPVDSPAPKASGSRLIATTPTLSYQSN